MLHSTGFQYPLIKYLDLIVGCWCKSAVIGARSGNGSTQWQHWGPNWSSTPARTTGRIYCTWGCQTRIGYPWPQPATPDYYKQQQHSVGGSGWAERCFQLLFQWPRHNVRILANLISNVISWMPLKVSRSRNMKQKIYEISTSLKIQTNGVILNNCIDWVCLCFDRLLLVDLSEVQVLRT